MRAKEVIDDTKKWVRLNEESKPECALYLANLCILFEKTIASTSVEGQISRVEREIALHQARVYTANDCLEAMPEPTQDSAAQLIRLNKELAKLKEEQAARSSS